MHPKYPIMFSPIKLGPIELPNRFYMSLHAVPIKRPPCSGPSSAGDSDFQLSPLITMVLKEPAGNLRHHNNCA